MKATGIDIGSLTTKAVIMEDNRVLGIAVVDSGDEAEASARLAFETACKQAGLNIENDTYIVTTGVGGKSVSFGNQQKAITTCLARGTTYNLPEARMVVDIGAESSMVLKINERGRVADWVNHDKCAAGTGIFLEQMAKLMQLPIAEMAELSLKAASGADITSTCAVFAESEVISHVHRDPPTPREEIALGIYLSVVSRIISMCKRIGVVREVAVTGGVALNRGIISALEKELGFKVLVPENPQLTAATGAAILARENIDKGKIS